jgi:putative ABC transport system permease protein
MAQKRTKEIGVRKILGASEAGIFFLLSGNFVRWVLAANLLAWPIAYLAMTQWLQNFAYRAPINWASFFLAGFISLFVAILTVCWQAVKVARTNPAGSLRHE